MDIKENFSSKYERRLKLLLKSKLNIRNNVLVINMWPVSVLRYGTGILKRITDKLKNIDKMLRKIVTMHGVFLFKSDTGRLYMTRLKERLRMISFEDCV